jgi:uncharacterized membrane protein
MKSKPIAIWESQSRRLRSLCVALLVFGMLFRFYNLDRKVYWHDEVYMAMEISAYNRNELVAEKFVGQEVTIAELQVYQQLAPNRTVADAVTTLGREDTQHPPLFYIFGRYWAMLWGGSSPTVNRSIAALLSLLVFPCLYGLCWLLFQSSLVGWVAIALHAVSPFHLLYAQEAREYSLWTATVLLTSITLLRAMRQSNWQNWLQYSLSLAIAFYTFLFSGLVAIGHAIYVLWNENVFTLSIAGFRLSRRAIAYCIASLVAIVLFIPWLYFLVNYYETVKNTTSWTTVSQPFSSLSLVWLFNFSRLYIDVGFDPFQPHGILAYILIVPIVLLQFYAIYFVCRHTPKPVWTFILTLIGSTTLTLMLPDLLMGGQRSGTARYMIPSYLGIQIAVAFLLATQMSSVVTRRRRFWQCVTGALVLLGIVSCGIISQASTWWNKGISYDFADIAKVINQSNRPVIISDAYAYNPGNVIALSYLLDDKATFILLPEVGRSPMIPGIPPTVTDVFLLNLPEGYRSQLEEQHDLSFAPVIGELWQAERME